MFRNCIVVVLTLSCLAFASGQTWVKVNGVDDELKAMTVFNGSIYGGGIFTTSNGEALSRVGVYSGRTWGSLGTGFDGAVNALHALGGESLIAAGEFSHSGSTLTGPTARWNGTAWVSMGFGIVGEVYCLGEYNGILYAGGNFFVQDSVYGFAKWDGERWVSAGVSMDNAVYAMESYSHGLIVGGDFTFAGSQFFNHIAKWDGNVWSTIGTGDSTGIFGVVRCMTVYHNLLLVGGGIDGAGNAHVRNIAAWNDTVWSGLGTGINGIPSSLLSTDSAVYAGGIFSEAGGASVQNIAVWNDGQWSPLGLGTAGPVDALASTSNGLFAGGKFTSAGGIPANNFGRWSKTANVATLIGFSFRDKDGKISTKADQTAKPWGMTLYADSISPGTIVTSGADAQLGGYLTKAGKYLLAEADSGSDWSRLGVHPGRVDTIMISLNTSVNDTFVNFHKNFANGISFQEGWNLVSAPVELADNLVSNVFPNASSSLFSYGAAAGYRSTPAIESGPGYWLKFDSAAVDSLFGGEVTTINVAVKAGWNLIGSISHPVPVASLIVTPTGILRSQFYEYSTGYHVAASIDPGKGYWIKAGGDGTITMNKPTSIPFSTPRNSPLRDELTIRDASGRSQSITLAVHPAPGSAGIAPGVDVSDMPPAGPFGGMDIRFVESKPVGSISGNPRTLAISGAAFPITVLWNVSSGYSYTWEGIGANASTVTMRGKGAVPINANADRFVVRSNESSSKTLPVAFALSANYPNPFNPSTSIALDLPMSGQVSLIIYDQLGREVERISNALAFEPGRHVFMWQANGNASGVYHCVATVVEPSTGAVAFRASRSMLLVK